MSAARCEAVDDRGVTHDVRTSDGTNLCTGCRHALGRLLDQVPLILEWLGDIPAGLTRGQGAGGSRTHARVPFDDGAWKAAHDYALVIRVATDAADGEDAVASARRCAGLWRTFGTPDVFRAVHAATRRAEAALQPPGRWYAGVCSAGGEDGPCEAHLYATSGRGIVVCPECGWRHDLAVRRAYLLDRAEDVLVTTREFVRAAPNLLGDRVEANTVRQWVARGKLGDHGTVTVATLTGSRQARLYRFGDLRDLVVASTTRPARTA